MAECWDKSCPICREGMSDRPMFNWSLRDVVVAIYGTAPPTMLPNERKIWEAFWWFK